MKVTIDVPADVAADLTTVMQSQTNTELTGGSLLAEYVRQSLGPKVRALRAKREAAAELAAEVVAREAVEAAKLAESAARNAAVAASYEATDLALEGIK